MFRELLIDTDSVPDALCGDPARLSQAVLNLLGNAVKFTAQGSIALRAELLGRQPGQGVLRPGSPAPDRLHLRFAVADAGIAPAKLGRVFEPFVQADTRLSRRFGGTGLGLAITPRLVALMDGELTVRSAPGLGSCFAVKLYLPELRARASQRVRPGGVRHVGYAGPRRRLLVVDNEEADRRLLIDRLAPLGFELLPAASGEAALVLLRNERVDAIFLDLAMPGIDGWTTLRQLRALGLSDAPAAIVSANAFDKGLDNGLGIRPQDFLVKPVRMTELLGWLQDRLALQWHDAEPDPPDAAAANAAAADKPMQPPPADALRALDELVRLGYLRGIQRKLDAIEAEHPASAAFVGRLRGLAKGFQLDTLAHLVQSALADLADPAVAAAAGVATPAATTPAATPTATDSPPDLPDVR